MTALNIYRAGREFLAGVLESHYIPESQVPAPSVARGVGRVASLLGYAIGSLTLVGVFGLPSLFLPAIPAYTNLRSYMRQRGIKNTLEFYTNKMKRREWEEEWERRWKVS